MYICYSFFFWDDVWAISWYISSEQSWRLWTWSVTEQEEKAREFVDTLDDERRWVLDPTATVVQGSFWSWSSYNQWIAPYQFKLGEHIIWEIIRVQMEELWVWVPNGTATQPKLDASNTLQDAAPKPLSLYAERSRNESVWWSTTKRNAVRIEVMTGIIAFWAWFGDLETRTDNEWTPAVVSLYDRNDVEIERTSVVPTVVDQSICGGWTPSVSPSACGNETTRRIWFTLSQSESEMLKYIVVVVWDDDDSEDAWTTDGNTEHLSLIWPTFVLPCMDTDNDDVCDVADICPYDAQKSTWDIWCWCWIQDPVDYWNACISQKSSCWEVWTWTVTCDGMCDAEIPSVHKFLWEECFSEKNVCGAFWTWIVLCDWSCSASDIQLPDGYGNGCTTKPNECWSFWTWTILCDWSCSAPFVQLPDSYWEECFSEENLCWLVWTWVIQCNGSCSAGLLPVPNTYTDICISASNDCWEFWTWKILCDGTCDAIIPSLPERYWRECVSEKNDCWQENLWVYLCDKTCSATPPSLPEKYRDPCESKKNNCWITNIWTISCDWTCNAVAPNDTLCESNFQKNNSSEKLDETTFESSTSIESEEQLSRISGSVWKTFYRTLKEKNHWWSRSIKIPSTIQYVSINEQVAQVKDKWEKIKSSKINQTENTLQTIKWIQNNVWLSVHSNLLDTWGSVFDHKQWYTEHNQIWNELVSDEDNDTFYIDSISTSKNVLLDISNSKEMFSEKASIILPLFLPATWVESRRSYSMLP